MTTLKTASEIFAANQILTVDIAKSLIGQRIQTVYSGYRGQDGDDNFVIGEVKREIYGNGKEGEICLFTIDGRNTFIRAHKFNNGEFTCSDSDRFVYYVALNQIKAVKSVNMFDNGDVAIIECKYYPQLSFEKLSIDSQKRLKGCVGVIDERGKEQWFTPDHFQL